MNLVCCLVLMLPAGFADEAARKEVANLIKQLDDKNDEKRIEALQELPRYGAEAKSALPAIGKALKSGSDEVRREAGKTLSRLGTHALDAIPDLIEALKKDKDARVRSYAAFAFKAMGRDGKAAVLALAEALKD